jgi:hypothetical protein
LATWSGALALLLVLGAGVPLFLRMPLWADPIQYDLAARNVLGGGVHYRDISDVNLPGMVWVHIAIRGLLGWSFVALRAADLVLVAGVVWLLVGWWGSDRFSGAARLWTSALLFAFYLSTSEMCHAQRDTWLLLPALSALYVRRRRLGPLTADRLATRRVALSGIAEGLLWGAAFWIKPHVAVPALACWLLSVIVLVRTTRGAWRRLLIDTSWVLLGALLIGAAGTVWLWLSGAWPYFVESCFVWTRGYYAHSPPFLPRTRDLLTRFFPWGCLHLAALPLAIWTVVRTCVGPIRNAPAGLQALLAAGYLGWCFQVHFLQLPHEYAWVPPTLLAITVLCGQVLAAGQAPVSRFALALFAVIALSGHPMLASGRLDLWPGCWQGGKSAVLRDRLTLATNPNRPSWQELEQVTAFLRGQHVQDGELTCNPASTQALLMGLGVRPATRYVNYDVMVSYFPERVEPIRQELSASRQRFVVSDLDVFDLSPPPGKPGSEDVSRAFPWTEPVVFRTRRYVVHRVTGPVGRLPHGTQVASH